MITIVRIAGKSISWIVGKICHWYVAVVVLFVGVCYFVTAPFFQQTEAQRVRAMAEKIPDHDFRQALARIDDAKRLAAMRSTFQAYDKVYGANLWGERFADEAKKEGRPRFADIAEIAIGISSAEDREKFISDHMDVYSMCLKNGWVELAHKYSDTLAELQSIGGKNWHVARNNPISVFVYSAIKDSEDLWNWYLNNASWCAEYLRSLAPDGGLEGVVELVKLLRANQEAFKLAWDEIRTKSDEELREMDSASGVELGRMGCYASTFAFISEWGDVLRPLARAKAPMLISFSVLAQSVDAFNLETVADRRAAGEKLATLWLQRDTSPIWYQASLPSGVGVVKLYEKVPQDAGKVVGLFGECYVAAFLLDENYYGQNDRLLEAATHAIAEWEDPGWAVLTRFKESDEFKRLLERKDIGCRVVPYVLNFGPDRAISELLSDSTWADRYFNEDGSLKKDKKFFIESLPFVGGISTVAKNWMKGYPCTMEEIGWATFDVVDVAVTIASFGAGKAATTALKEGGKQGSKMLVKQGATSAGKTLLKRGGKYALEETAKRSSSNLALRILRGVGHGLAVGGAWTIKIGKIGGRVVAMPVGRIAAAWKSLPPAVRKGVIRTVACVMFGVVVWNRTLKLLPGIVHDVVAEVVVMAERISKAVAAGLVDGLKGALADLLNTPDLASSSNLQKALSWACAGGCMFLMLLVIVRRRRTVCVVSK